jgi:hypothetical protein
MSAALFIVPEREVEGLDHFVNGKALGHAQNLDRIAIAAGVRPLMEYFSMGPEEAASTLEGFGGEIPVEGLPDEAWFDAAEGLRTVRGMLRHLSENPTVTRDVEAISRDLREFDEVLSGLEKAGVRWHLGVDC